MIAPVTGPGAAVVQEVKKNIFAYKQCQSVFKMFSKCQSVQNIFKVFQSVSKVSFVKMFYFIRLSEEKRERGSLLLADRRGYPRVSGDTRISSDVRGYQVILWCQGIPGYPLI